MRVVIQRCTNASVKFNGKENYIDKGLMVLLGITKGDTIDDIKYIIKKITNLRIFEDDNYKMNYSVKDINGSILLVSQFTLYASTKDGNRPSFTNSLAYDDAKELYDLFIEELKKETVLFKTGEFGADMEVSLVNDGPVTIIIDSKERV